MTIQIIVSETVGVVDTLGNAIASVLRRIQQVFPYCTVIRCVVFHGTRPHSLRAPPVAI